MRQRRIYLGFKICKICNEEYFTLNNKRDHCGKRNCENEYKIKYKKINNDIHYNNNYINNCLVCGKTIKTHIKNKHYCSDECYNLRYENKCIICGKLFRTNIKQKLCCSDNCYNFKYEKICLFCNKKFNTNSHNKQCCSEECRNNYNKLKYENKKLQKNSQTEIDISEKLEDIRLIFNNRPINTWFTSGFNKSLKQKILNRDDNKCYICGKETNLHVHHIIPRVHGGPHIPENLITLCSGCHRSVESGNIELAVKNCVKRALNNYN
jgi:hypothetical protein